MPEHQFINDLGPNSFAEGVYNIQNAQLGMTKNGKPFLKGLIGDSSGKIPARMWNCTEEQFATIPTNGFVRLSGHSQAYQGQIQFIIQNLTPTEVTSEDLAMLLPHTEKNVDEMFAAITALMESLENAAARAISRAYLDDQDLMRSFRQAPAAQSLHHAFIGGLLEHTLQVCQLADAMLPLYPRLNRDMILLGLFLHDIAKCSELCYGEGFSYSDEGQLIGHLVMGVLWLDEKLRELESAGTTIPEETALSLKHIILSHHGLLEFGSPKLPATPEAIFISRLDELDAKVQMAMDAARPLSGPREGDDGAFTDKVWALGTRVYRRDPFGATS